jgi:hypothetical protein
VIRSAGVATGTIPLVSYEPVSQTRFQLLCVLANSRQIIRPSLFTKQTFFATLILWPSSTPLLGATAIPGARQAYICNNSFAVSANYSVNDGIVNSAMCSSNPVCESDQPMIMIPAGWLLAVHVRTLTRSRNGLWRPCRPSRQAPLLRALPPRIPVPDK